MSVADYMAKVTQLQIELAKVTAERDEARAWADKLRTYAHEEGTYHPWERATPTEGE